MSSLFILLILLQLKHWFVDFVLQTDDMVKGKGIYGNPDGVNHSLQHAIATLWIVFYVTWNPLLAIGLSALDFITHYHIDYVKIKYGERDITLKQFWTQLGLDQMAHQLTYILFAVIYWINHA